jgi:hypothetical protein
MNKDNNSWRSSKRPPKGTIVRYGWTEAQIKEQETANAKSKQRREAEKLAVLARSKTTASINTVMSTSSKTDEAVEGAGASTRVWDSEEGRRLSQLWENFCFLRLSGVFWLPLPLLINALPSKDAEKFANLNKSK